jgi:hypothetical protein
MSQVPKFNQSSTTPLWKKGGYRDEESFNLYNKVMTKNKLTPDGDMLSPKDIIRFVNHLQYGAFGKGLAEKGLATFPQEFRLRLYEIVSHGQRPYHLQFGEQKEQSTQTLTFLSEQLGLTDKFYRNANKANRDFLAPENLGKLDAAWKAWGHSKKFSDMLVRAQRPSTEGGLSIEKKKQLLMFMQEQMNSEAGRKCSLTFSSGLKSGGALCGGYAYTDILGNNHVAINSDYLDRQFGDVIDTFFHENDHIHQHELSNGFLNGIITEDHPDYTAARVFAANRRAYIHPDDDKHGYRAGAMEVSARALGANAQQQVEQLAKAPTIRQYGYEAAVPESKRRAGNEDQHLKIG